MPGQPERPARNLVRRARTALGAGGHAPVANTALEPCVGCGEETATGSVFYSDRHVIGESDGTSAFLCSLCNARVRASGKGGGRLTDEEVRNALENGSAAAYLWGSAGQFRG